MEIRGKVAIVTGGGSGIGAGAAKRFAQEGARAVVVADLNFENAKGVADDIGAVAMRCDVSREEEIQQLVAEVDRRFGAIDIFFSNAGIIGSRGGIELDNTLWQKMWDVHVMAHVWAARCVVPAMLERKEGYFVVTASAAGLLNIVESAAYGVTKHAAVGLAEWFRIAYGRRGLRVSCLCPQSVATSLAPQRAGKSSSAIDGVLSAQQVADDLVEGMRDERFLILPHPEVANYFAMKAHDYDRWLGGMQKLHARHVANSEGET